MRTKQESYIYNMNKPSVDFTQKLDTKNNKYYDLHGKLLKTKDDPLLVCAKIEQGKFYVRINIKNQMYEPHSLDALERDKKLARGSNLEPAYAYKFREVQEDCFNNYKKYLETQSTARIKMCQNDIDTANIKTNGSFVMTEGLSLLNDEEKPFVQKI